MKLTIRGPARVDTSRVPEQHLKTIRAGVVSKKSCCDFFSFELLQLNLGGGQIQLLYEPITRSWQVSTVYLRAGKLTDAQVQSIVAATKGQWADGLGVGCFAEIEEATGAVIDLCPLEAANAVEVNIDPQFKVPLQPATLLSTAARTGDLRLVQQLLDDGADIEEKQQGSSPLYGSVISGHKDVALELIRRGADVFARNESGDDALMAAALSNKLNDDDAAAVAFALLQGGVEPNGKRASFTPLYMALNREKAKLAHVLREHGAVEDA